MPHISSVKLAVHFIAQIGVSRIEESEVTGGTTDGVEYSIQRGCQRDRNRGISYIMNARKLSLHQNCQSRFLHADCQKGLRTIRSVYSSDWSTRQFMRLLTAGSFSKLTARSLIHRVMIDARDLSVLVNRRIGLVGRRVGSLVMADVLFASFLP